MKNEMTTLNNDAIQICESAEFGKLEIVMIDGRPHFPATECARMLGYLRPADAITAHCKGSVKRRVLTSGGLQEVKFIPEGDLYRLIAKSKLPAAEKFEHWVFDEVLPSIRKYGAYMTPEKIEEILFNPELIIELATELRNERDRRLELESKNKTLEIKNEVLVEKIEEDAPKVEFADALSASNESIPIGDFAKLLNQNGIDIGRNRMFEYLRVNGYLIKSGVSKNLPTQKYMDSGLFEIHESGYYPGYGEWQISLTAYITGKGQRYFFEKFFEHMSA